MTTTSDAVANGDGCSLREAIVNANNNQPTNPDCAGGSGTDTIAFNIPAAIDPGCNAATGVCTITPAAGPIVFPAITDPVIVDGYTQPGASANTNATGGLNTVLMVEISGANFTGVATLAPVFRVQAGNSTIRGLSINRFANAGTFSPAIVLETNGGNTIAGNFIGTSVAGTAPLPNNGGVGVRSSNNTIGGLTPAARNLLFNRSGASGTDAPDVDVNGGSNLVQGNLLGTTRAGTAILGGSPGTGVTVRSLSGSSASGNTIGGTTAAARNVVAGYQNAGVALQAAGAGNVVRGNSLGTDATGAANLPNGYGVSVESTTGVEIGGTTAGSGNLIRFNLLGGVVVRDAASTGVSILGNSIVGNGALGIDLGGNGPDANDFQDADAGPNNGQNYPVITSPVGGAAGSSIQGSLNSTPNTTFRVELFSNFGCDASGFGEGETFLGAVDVTTDALGNAQVNAPFAVPAGRSASATATDPSGNTSEFSACPQAEAAADLSISKTGPPVAEVGIIAYTITVTNTSAAAAQNVGVIDPTPRGLTFFSNVGACTTTFPCALGTLGPGESRTMTSRYTLPSDLPSTTPLSNTATVTSTTSDPNPSNNSATTTANGASADLSITKTGPPIVGIGNVEYVITVTNNGTNSAQNVTVTDVTPGGLTFQANRGDCTTQFPCAFGTLGPGQSRTITSTYTLSPDFPGITQVSNTATVTSSTSDPDLSNNSATTTATVPHSLAISKTGPATTTTGSTIAYTITVVNGSATPLTDVVVSDVLPSELSFIGNTGDCTTVFPCALGALAPGASRVIRSSFQVIATEPGLGPITNAAVVDGAMPGGGRLQARALATTVLLVPTQHAAPVAVAPPPVEISPGDDDTDKPRKETDEQRQQRRLTNRSNQDDVHTEGNVVGVRLTLDDPVPEVTRGFIAQPDAVPYVLIANRDGVQEIILRHDARLVGPSVKIGQYVTADGQKESEQLFIADDLEIAR